jgi:hypothetical protein
MYGSDLATSAWYGRRTVSNHRWTVRRFVVTAGLGLAVAVGAVGCGSSKTNAPASPAPAGATNAPITTTPPTTVPSGGGVSY